MLRRCAALIPYARNARTHSDQQVAQIAASIREFGFTNPVLIVVAVSTKAETDGSCTMETGTQVSLVFVSRDREDAGSRRTGSRKARCRSAGR
jgi:hypothetical protein